MNAADTADIVRRIVTTWPMSPKGFVWTDALAELEYGPALAAYVRLRDELDEQRVSVARFKSVARALTNDVSPRQHPGEGAVLAGPPMSFPEYLALITWRAGTGDSEANAALDEWSTPRARRLLAILQGGDA